MTKTVEELQAELTAALDSIAKLDAKNKETIREKQRIADEAKAAREAAEEAAAEAALKSGDVEAIKAAHAKELQKIQDNIADRDRQLSTLLIDNAIKDGLAEHNIPVHHHKALTAMFKADAKLDGSEAKVGDVGLKDFMKSFMTSDEGKHYVPAPQNGGGGAMGSNAKAMTLSKTNFSHATFDAAYKADPSGTVEWCKSNGYADLVEGL